MREINNIVLFLLLSTITTKAFAQKDSLLTPEQMKTDVDFYFKSLYKHHPDPYYYYPLKEFEKKKTEIYSQLDKSLTHEQFAWIIGEINSYLDAHSRLGIYGQTHWRRINLRDKSIRLFPVVKYKNDKMYFKDNNIAIDEINGVKVNVIIQDLKKYINWKLPHESNVYHMISSFSGFLMNKYNIKAPFRVKFDNSNKIELYDGYTVDKYMRESFSDGFRGGSVGYTYRIYPFSSIAIFSMPDFAAANRDSFRKKFAEFLEETSKMKIENIFYDLTMNPGGYPFFEALDIVRHDSVYYKFEKTERVDHFNRKYKVNDVVLCPNKNTDIPTGRKLFVLQGITTTSSADYFCRTVSENKLGTLVGQNTGEPTKAFTSCYIFEMPNSKIAFCVASAFYDFSQYFKDELLHPDVYWDVNHCREFTEEDLIDIVEHCVK